MAAIRSLRDEGILRPDNFELRLRDSGHDAHFSELARTLGVSELVSLLGPLPYRQALAEMLDSDGLLVLQGKPSNPAIPAKVYEYLRARRPILGLVHPDGETATLLRHLGLDTMAPLDDIAGIRKLLLQWLTPDRKFELPTNEAVVRYSRGGLTGD